MKKESFYIQHDYNAFLDPKIRFMVYEHSVIAYAVFWIALEILASQKDYRARRKGFVEGILPLIQGKNVNIERGDGIVTGSDDAGKPLNLDLIGCYSISLARLKQMLDDMIEVGLFATDDEYIWSESLNARMEYRREISEKRKDAGRLGGLSKAGYKAKEANAKQKIANAKQDSIVQDRKGYIKKPTKNDESLIKKPVREEKPDNEVLKQFWGIAKSEQWTTQDYEDAKTKQFYELSKDGKEEILKKMRVMINCTFSKSESTQRMAKKIYHETVGLIQDRALDKSTIDGKTLAKRREFEKEENGKNYVEQELDPAPF